MPWTQDTVTMPWSDHGKDLATAHIEPDWLLIYRKETERLFLERTGSHSELFKK